jgi:hypothetical protein
VITTANSPSPKPATRQGEGDRGWTPPRFPAFAKAHSVPFSPGEKLKVPIPSGVPEGRMRGWSEPAPGRIAGRGEQGR